MPFSWILFSNLAKLSKSLKRSPEYAESAQYNHLDFQDLRALNASDKTVLSINAIAVLITIVIDIIFFKPTRI